MDLLQKAKELLVKNEYTFVAIDKDKVYTSSFHGIRPIMEKVVPDKEYFKGYYVADKVIGKSAALLLIRSKIAFLHAEVLSEHAKALLDTNQVLYTYDKLVPYIINRTHDGICPMEKSVLECNDLEAGFLVLKETLRELQNKK